MIKRIYKDFIIAFLNSRGEIPFTFLKERLKEETLLNPHSKAISIYLRKTGGQACIFVLCFRSINRDLQESHRYD